MGRLHFAGGDLIFGGSDETEFAAAERVALAHAHGRTEDTAGHGTPRVQVAVPGGGIESGTGCVVGEILEGSLIVLGTADQSGFPVAREVPTILLDPCLRTADEFRREGGILSLELCHTVVQTRGVEGVDGKGSVAALGASRTADEPGAGALRGIGEDGVHDLHELVIARGEAHLVRIAQRALPTVAARIWVAVIAHRRACIHRNSFHVKSTSVECKLDRMLLETHIVIRRAPEEVWAYLGNIHNIAHWDRGVAETEARPASPPGVGFEFTTLARSPRSTRDKNWGKMSYRITEIDPVRGCTIQLTSKTGNARFFRHAEWRFRVEPDESGSRVFCTALFRLRFPYQILAPVFYSMKSAIYRDLESLRDQLEAEAAAAR